MAILLQLGANQTAFIQFLIFIISISFLTIFVFSPYFKAYDQRLNQTKGAEQVAIETQDEAKKLELIFQSKAREANERIKNIFNTSRAQAVVASADIINEARAAAEDLAITAKKALEAQRAGAQMDINIVSNEIARELTKKMTGVVQ